MDKICITERLDSFDNYDLDGTLNTIIKKLTDILDKVPEEYRDAVVIDSEVYNNYGDHYCDFTVCYRRLETDGEYENRMKMFEERDSVIKKSKLKQFNALKEELGL